MIEVRDLRIVQGGFALEHVSFTVQAGDYAVLMGRSGCGKSTILEAICGLRPVAGGSVCLAGRDVTSLTPGARGVGYVPQDRALFPHLSVRENLAFGLVVRHRASAEIAARVDELADLLGIRALLDRDVGNLSGGEAQRVSVGRAIAARPPVLCLDEPLAGLDEETHEEMCALLRAVHGETGVTVLHVTHSRHEAERNGDVVLRLCGGAVTTVAIAREA